MICAEDFVFADAPTGRDDALRLAKAANKRAKRQRREALRARNVALALAAAARKSPAEDGVRAAAAEARALADATPPPSRWVALALDPDRREAARRASVVTRRLLSSVRDGDAREMLAATRTPEAAARATALLRRCAKGTQARASFDDALALAGYVRRKFTQRALRTFDALAEADRAHPWASRALREAGGALAAAAAASTRPPLVVSVGGGPGNDLFGFVLFEELRLRREAAAAAASPPQLSSSPPSSQSSPPPARAELLCLDFAADAWAPWARAVDEQLVLARDAPDEAGGDGVAGRQPRLRIEPADLAAPFDALRPTARAALERARLVTWSYVLTECRGRWEEFLSDAFDAARPGALFLIAEPTRWMPARALALLEGRDAGLTYAWLDVRSSAAPPSVLLLMKHREDSSRCRARVSSLDSPDGPPRSAVPG